MDGAGGTACTIGIGIEMKPWPGHAVPTFRNPAQARAGFGRFFFCSFFVKILVLAPPDIELTGRHSSEINICRNSFEENGKSAVGFCSKLREY